MIFDPQELQKRISDYSLHLHSLTDDELLNWGERVTTLRRQFLEKAAELDNHNKDGQDELTIFECQNLK